MLANATDTARSAELEAVNDIVEGADPTPESATMNPLFTRFQANLLKHQEKAKGRKRKKFAERAAKRRGTIG